MLSYNEDSIVSRLRALSRRDIAVFAYGCARRAESCAEDPAVAASVRDALTALEAAILGSGNVASVRLSLSRLESLDIDSDAHAAALYAVRAWLTGEPLDAASAARRAYESRDEFAANGLDVGAYTAEVEKNILSHPAVQLELEAQASDLAAVESGNYLSVIQNERA